VLALILRQLGRNRHRAFVQVEHVVCETEPEGLSRTYLTGDEYQPRRMLRKPRREFIQLLNVESAATARRVLDRLDGQDRIVDVLSALFRLS